MALLDDRSPSSELDDRATKVLLVEDSPTYVALVEAHLEDAASRTYELTRVDTLSGALEALDRESFDVVLLDLNLPDSQGEQTLTSVHEAAPSAPVVVLTGQDDRALALAGVRKGAQDYLSKGAITGEMLERSIVYAIDRRAAMETLERRTRELAQSNAELERFAYVACHHLQEPVRTVVSFAQLLASLCQGKLEPKADECIEHTIEGALRIKALLQDFLTYSGVRAKRVSPSRVDLNDALGAVAARFETRLAECGGRIERPRLPCVLGDRALLERLLEDLIGNALKFRGADPPAIRVSAEEDAASWTITVADNGIGIDPRYAERVFAIFERLHAAREYPGTGIGLALCRRIVGAHDGRIWLDSTPGRGSAFHFSLPKRTRAPAATL
jgi:light-regulated signal transduction histidine kinase (bacteriophytochrome)